METLLKIFKNANSREEKLAGIYLIPKLLELTRGNLEILLEILPWEYLMELDSTVVQEIVSTFQEAQVFSRELLELKITLGLHDSIERDLGHFSLTNQKFNFSHLNSDKILQGLALELKPKLLETTAIISQLLDHEISVNPKVLEFYLKEIIEILSVKSITDQSKDSVFFLISKIQTRESNFILENSQTILKTWEKRVYFLIQMAAIHLNWSIDAKSLAAIPLMSILLMQLLEILMQQIDNIHDVDSIMQIKDFTNTFFIQLLSKICDLFHSKELDLEYYTECINLICFWMNEQEVEEQLEDFQEVLVWFNSKLVD